MKAYLKGLGGDAGPGYNDHLVNADGPMILDAGDFSRPLSIIGEGLSTRILLESSAPKCSICNDTGRLKEPGCDEGDCTHCSVELDERGEFEAYHLSLLGTDADTLERHPWGYMYPRAYDGWDAWQARAAVERKS